ncbi:hypothetical protein MOMA_09161 [Moraxella macacae 0408225]|uniref:Peptidase C51 domain-containing protein n=1 Tax=Moraxella macacae 0408225 TaxID=1230338 RepID=L2F7H7_9GAMM|nr:TIGR02594 family protein [Moraxella macacae]ELA08716.1 hypothetical protein MOMA_09161 [Moraxella macacae 0408225]
MTIANELKWIANARKLVGITEIKWAKHNPVIIGLWRSAFEAVGQQPPAVFKNDETAWCGGFVGGVLADSGLGYHIPNAFPMARAWLKAGTKLDKPAYGCIVVFWRGTPKSASGHVGFVVGRDRKGNLMVLGGNQSDKVSIVPFATSRVLGYRWCGTLPNPAKHRYDLPLLDSDGRVSKNEA